MKPKRNYTPDYKVKIVIEVLKENNTISEIASREGINVKQIYNWRSALLNNAGLIYDQNRTEREFEKRLLEAVEREEVLVSKVGRLTIENDWLKKKYTEITGKL
jgi:transposase-like protein